MTVSLRRALLGKGVPEPSAFRHIASKLAAYAVYMRGLTFLGQRTSEGIYKAIDVLEQMIRRSRGPMWRWPRHIPSIWENGRRRYPRRGVHCR